MSTNGQRVHLLVDDELTQLEIYADRAACILQDLTDSFFGLPNPFDEKAHLVILSCYADNGVRAEIVSDYLRKLRRMLSEVIERTDVAAMADLTTQAEGA